MGIPWPYKYFVIKSQGRVKNIHVCSKTSAIAFAPEILYLVGEKPYWEWADCSMLTSTCINVTATYPLCGQCSTLFQSPFPDVISLLLDWIRYILHYINVG